MSVPPGPRTSKRQVPPTFRSTSQTTSDQPLARASEVRALREEDYDPPCLPVRQKVRRVKGGWIFEEVQKTKQSRRTIMLPAFAQVAISGQLTGQGGLLFRSQSGDRYSRRTHGGTRPRRQGGWHPPHPVPRPASYPGHGSRPRRGSSAGHPAPAGSQQDRHYDGSLRSRNARSRRSGSRSLGADIWVMPVAAGSRIDPRPRASPIKWPRACPH